MIIYSSSSVLVMIKFFLTTLFFGCAKTKYCGMYTLRPGILTAVDLSRVTESQLQHQRQHLTSEVMKETEILSFVNDKIEGGIKTLSYLCLHP